MGCSHEGPYIHFSRKFSELSIAKGCDVSRSVRADMNKHAKCVHSTKGTFWHRNRLPFVFGGIDRASSTCECSNSDASSQYNVIENYITTISKGSLIISF